MGRRVSVFVRGVCVRTFVLACFTSTKVQILTPAGMGRGGRAFDTLFSARFSVCTFVLVSFTSTKVQILTPAEMGRGGRAFDTLFGARPSD